METTIIKEKQDLTFLNWSHIRSSSGTAGTFLKAEGHIGSKKKYYKLSNYDYAKGVIGHECINEIIVARLLSILGIEHLNYELIHADIEIEGRVYETYLCASEDFKERGESKTSLDDYYRINAISGESHYEFCVRNGWRDYIDRMIVVDYLILNRDRHGANIEVLRNARAHSIRIAPLFDHGLSLLYNCLSEDAVNNFDILEDKRCNNYIGSHSCYENLNLVEKGKKLFKRGIQDSDKQILFEGLDGIISVSFIDKVWSMIYERYQIYENL